MLKYWHPRVSAEASSVEAELLMQFGSSAIQFMQAYLTITTVQRNRSRNRFPGSESDTDRVSHHHP